MHASEEFKLKSLRYPEWSRLQENISIAKAHDSDCDRSTRLSVFTLAALADSGWYKVNYSIADSLYFGNGLAGWDLFSDGCPTPVSKPGSDCIDPLAKSQGKLGPQSRCFEVLGGLSARTRDCICIEHEIRILKN